MCEPRQVWPLPVCGGTAGVLWCPSVDHMIGIDSWGLLISHQSPRQTVSHVVTNRQVYDCLQGS